MNNVYFDTVKKIQNILLFCNQFCYILETISEGLKLSINKDTTLKYPPPYQEY